MAEATIRDLSPKEVQEKIDNGKMSVDAGKRYIAKKQLADKGLMGMSPKAVKFGVEKDIIPVDDGKAYVERHNSPISYYLKDVTRGVLSGIEKGAVHTGEFIVDAAMDYSTANFVRQSASAIAKKTLEKENAQKAVEKIMGVPDVSGEEVTDVATEALKEHANFLYETNRDLTNVRSTPGKLTETLAQFATPYTGTFKMVKGGKIASKILSSGRISQLAQKMPKTAKFIANIGEDALRGIPADLAAWDPYDDNLFDMMSEFDEGQQNAIVEFLKTDPDNPAAVERLKQALEGVALAATLDPLVGALGRVSRKIWSKSSGKARKVRQFVNKRIGKKLGIDTDPLKGVDEEFDKAVKQQEKDLAEETSGEKAAETAESKAEPEVKGRVEQPKPDQTKVTQETTEGQAVSDQTANKLNQRRPGERTNVASEEDMTDMGMRFLKAAFNDEQVQVSDNEFLEKMDVPAFGKMIIKKIRESNIADLEAAGVSEGGTIKTIPRKKTEQDAIKELARLTGSGFEETMEASRELLKDAQNMRVRVDALNKFFATYTDVMDRMVQKPAKEVTFEDKLKFLEHSKNVQELTSIVFGVRSEAGRLLDMYNNFPFQSISKRLEKVHELDIEDIMKGNGEEIDKAWETYRNAKDVYGRMAAARSTGSNTFLKGVLEYVQANLLWDPATHAANVVGNSLAIANNYMKRAGGLGYHALKTKDANVLKEIAYQNHGFGVGLIEALRVPGVTKKNFYNPKTFMSSAKSIKNMDDEAGNVWKALFSGNPQLDPRRGMIEGQTTNIYQKVDKWAVQKLDDLGLNVAGVRLPMRTLIKSPFLPFHALTAGDELFKNIGYFSELHAQAARAGIDKGLKGKDLDTYVRSLLERPDKKLHYKSLERSREVTFTSDLGPASDKLSKFLNTNIGLGIKIAKLPFYKVVVNLMKYAGHNSPLGWMAGKGKEMIQAGGREKYEAIAGMVQGSALIGAAAYMYENGMITGRTPNGMRDTWNNLGIREYSVYNPWTNSWISYNRVDPMATLIGAAANAARAIDTFREYAWDEDMDVEERIAEITWAFGMIASEAVTNHTFTKNLQDLTMLATQSEYMDWEGEAARQTEKFIPYSTALSAWQERLVDDTVRRVETASDAIISKVNSKANYPRRHNIYGTKIEREDRFAWFFKQRTETEDPVAKELQRLGASISAPSEQIEKFGVPVELDQKQYDQLNQLIAQMPVKEVLTELISKDAYKRLNTEEQVKQIRKVVQEIRSRAREQLMRGSTKIQKELKDEIRHRMRVRAGIEKPDDHNKNLTHFLEWGENK